MDEKQPSRFVIFHLEVFVMPLHQTFPFPHPIMTSTSWRQLYIKWRSQERYRFYRQFVCRLRNSVSCKKRWT